MTRTLSERLQHRVARAAAVLAAFALLAQGLFVGLHLATHPHHHGDGVKGATTLVAHAHGHTHAHAAHGDAHGHHDHGHSHPHAHPQPDGSREDGPLDPDHPPHPIDDHRLEPSVPAASPFGFTAEQPAGLEAVLGAIDEACLVLARAPEEGPPLRPPILAIGAPRAPPLEA
jgi:hypothetical protein